MKTLTITVQISLNETDVQTHKNFIDAFIKEVNDNGITQSALDLSSKIQSFAENTTINAKLK